MALQHYFTFWKAISCDNSSWTKAAEQLLYDSIILPVGKLSAVIAVVGP
jgi:hypothetical protein